MGRNYRKRKAFCERPFALHRQQPEKDKRSFDVPPWKKFCVRPWMHWFRSTCWVIKHGAVWFNSYTSHKNDKCQSCQFPSSTVYTKCSNQKTTILMRGEQPKNMKNQQRSILIFKREAPKSARPNG